MCLHTLLPILRIQQDKRHMTSKDGYEYPYDSHLEVLFSSDSFDLISICGTQEFPTMASQSHTYCISPTFPTPAPCAVLLPISEKDAAKASLSECASQNSTLWKTGQFSAVKSVLISDHHKLQLLLCEVSSLAYPRKSCPYSKNGSFTQNTHSHQAGQP